MFVTDEKHNAVVIISVIDCTPLFNKKYCYGKIVIFAKIYEVDALILAI